MLRLTKVILIASCIPLVLASCKSDIPRTAKGSLNLTGLWKMNRADGGGVNKVTNEGLLLVDNGLNVEVTKCLGHEKFGALRFLDGLSNFPDLPNPTKFFDIWSNDHMSYANVSPSMSIVMRKMTKVATFDMGSYKITSSLLPSATITNDNCTVTETVTNLGGSLETFHIVTGYEGGLLNTKLEFKGKVSPRNYSIGAVTSGSVKITLSSDKLIPFVGAASVVLSGGTLEVKKRNPVYLEGIITSTLTGGATLAIDFKAELPN